MRCLFLILLLASAPAAEEVLLHEQRAWKGVVTVESVARGPERVKGTEKQTERIEFLLVTHPPRRTMAHARLPFAQRETLGRWSLSLDVRDGEGREAVVTKGEGAGRLHARIAGWMEPKTKRYRLALQATPAKLTARTSVAGMWKDRPTVWRTVTVRRPFLITFKAEGEATDGGRVLAGERRFVDRKEKYARDVTIAWRVERLDPVVRGRVVDQHGRPLADLKVVAWTTNPKRVRRGLPPLYREGKTDADGRFRVGVTWSHWHVEVHGADRGPLVIEGARYLEGAPVRFDSVPHLEVKLNVFRREALPRSELLTRHFRGDVKSYFAFVRDRVSKRRMEAALAPPGER